MKSDIAAILLMAGSSTRSGLQTNKCLYSYHGMPLFMNSLEILLRYPFERIILVVNPLDTQEISQYLASELSEKTMERIDITMGGETRSKSVINGLRLVKNAKVLIHDAARINLTIEDCFEIDTHLDFYDGVSFYYPVVDTIKEMVGNNIKTLKRENLKAVTTPQGFKKSTYDVILNNQNSDYDELMTLENSNFDVGFIEEKLHHYKLTKPADFKKDINHYWGDGDYKIGHSFDFHPFDYQRNLVLGGVKFDYPGLKGHSDADALLHAVAESIIGALGLGDIGTHFPDNDLQYKNKDSSFFVIETKKMMKGYEIVNIDCLIYLEDPKLKDAKELMSNNIAKLLEIDNKLVNVKATTMEKKGVIGSKEGIACECFLLIRKK